MFYLIDQLVLLDSPFSFELVRLYMDLIHGPTTTWTQQSSRTLIPDNDGIFNDDPVVTLNSASLDHDEGNV